MNEPTKAEIADCLDKAHDELLVRGWCQGTYVDRRAAVCAEGAIRCAVGGTPNTVDEADASLAHAALLTLSKHVGGSAFAWNDDDGRTIDDVLDAFRHAAKRVREQAS